MNFQKLIKQEINSKTKKLLGLDLDEEWEKEYRRLGNMYAFWGGIMVVFFYPTSIFPQWSLPKDNETLWYFFRLAPAVIVAITLVLFRVFKFRHEIVFEIIAFVIYMGGAYWVNSTEWMSHLISATTLFLTGAILTILRPYMFVINFCWVLIINVSFYIYFCNKTFIDFWQEKGSASFLVAGIACFTVAIYRYYLMKNNFKQQFTLREALEMLEERHEELRQQTEEILEQRDEIELQKNTIETKNNDIISSITYAKRIQTAILPQTAIFDAHFKEAFVLYKPKDIISGDFYWVLEHENLLFFAVVDCTGHGVPGALMSMLAKGLLDNIILDKNIFEPNKILQELDRTITYSLKQSTTDMYDGLDCALCMWDKSTRKLQVAGAHQSVLFIENGEPKIIRTSNRGIGGRNTDTMSDFGKHEIDITENATIYLFSDGFQDQFGGEQSRKYSSKKLYDLLHANHNLSMKEQHTFFNNTIESWIKAGRQYQIDDITLMGIRL